MASRSMRVVSRFMVSHCATTSPSLQRKGHRCRGFLTPVAHPGRIILPSGVMLSTILDRVAENLKKHLSKLSKRGPHRVMVGDLDYAGLPGKIYTPAEGNGVPGVAFGHDWMKPIKHYHQTLRHLASWGIAVA